MGRVLKMQTSSKVKPATEKTDAPIFIAPPLALDNQATSESSFDGESKHQKSLLQQIFELVKMLRPGANLTSIPVPPQFSMPKSQLQLYAEQFYCSGENLLNQCADEDDPIERFVAVVRWHLSLTRPTPFLKAPYNPILGETHHVSAGDLNVLSEQVSHHPPVSALYATNTRKKIEVYQCSKPVPKLSYGSVEVPINGLTTLKLGERGETYEMTTPVLSFRFLPKAGSAWTGDTTVRCIETGLEARISFKPHSFPSWGKRCSTQIYGTILNLSSKKEEILYNFSGCWDKNVELQNARTGETKVLYDARAALTNLNTPVVKSQELPATESVLVWSKVTAGLWHEDWESARKAKMAVEEEQRELRKTRAKEGVTWKPQFFKQTADDGWEWAAKGKPVPQALIVV